MRRLISLIMRSIESNSINGEFSRSSDSFYSGDQENTINCDVSKLSDILAGRPLI